MAAIAGYVGAPLLVYGLNRGDPLDLAMQLAALLLLVLAARLIMTIAASTLIAVLPIALGAGLAGFNLAAQLGLPDMASLPAAGLISVILAMIILGLLCKFTSNWRPAAMAGFQLTAGALVLAGLSGIEADAVLVALPGVALLGGTCLVLAFGLYALIVRSAAVQGLYAARQSRDAGLGMAVPVHELATLVILASGPVLGLAALLFWQSSLAGQPVIWPGVWLGVIATVILAGQRSLAETCFVGLPVLALPRLFIEMDIGLPDLTLPAAILALVLATFNHRGERPGDRRAMTRGP